MFRYDTDKETYLLYSRQRTFRDRCKKALEICEKALQESSNPCLSFSGGKDSVVMLDLAYRAGFRGKLVFFKYGICTDTETPSENVAMLKTYSKCYNLESVILDCLGESDCWEMCGRFILEPETKEEKIYFNLTNNDFRKKFKSFEDEEGIDLNFIGMCKDESRTRKIMLSKKGDTYKTASRRSVTCCPLADFTARDVWSYIFSRDLPYLKIYDYPYIDRCVNRNEITMLYNDAIIRNGMMFHYKQMYPEYFQWLKNRWGSI